VTVRIPLAPSRLLPSCLSNTVLMLCVAGLATLACMLGWQWCPNQASNSPLEMSVRKEGSKSVLCGCCGAVWLRVALLGTTVHPVTRVEAAHCSVLMVLAAPA
jgi:hypothetical protein